MPICGGARTAAESVSHNFPRTNSAAATETRGGVAGSVTHNFCRTETCVLTETDRDQSMRMSLPRSPLSLSLSLARPFLRPPFRGESLRATENHHRRAGTDRPTERGSERQTEFGGMWCSGSYCSERGRGRRGTRERGASYRCGYVSWPTTPRRPLPRSAPLRFRPSVRSMDHLTSVRSEVNARSPVPSSAGLKSALLSSEPRFARLLAVRKIGKRRGLLVHFWNKSS